MSIKGEKTQAKLNRNLRMGMIGGGPGAFIGEVHRKAARMDGGVDLVAGADYVVTDGGSIQEETYYLNVPCLIMRSKTERVEGLGENAYLAEFDEDQIEQFFQTLPSLRRQDVEETAQPSAVIVDQLLAWA